jgi:Outer membrane protein beta-barrel domain
MTKHIKGLSILFLFFYINANSQITLSLTSGIGQNDIKTATVFSNQNTKYKGLPAFMVGVGVQKEINDWFAIRTELNFTKKSYQRYRTGFFSENYQDFENGFLQIPVIGHFSFGSKKWKAFLNLGLTADYWVSKRTSGSLYNLGDQHSSYDSYPKGLLSDEAGFLNFDIKVPFDKQIDQRLLFGYVAGVGADYKINKSYTVYTEYRINNSINSLVKNYQIGVVPRINNTQYVLLGLKRNFNFKKSQSINSK